MQHLKLLLLWLFKGEKQLRHREERGKTGGVVGGRFPPQLGCWLVVSWLSSEGKGREERREEEKRCAVFF